MALFERFSGVILKDILRNISVVLTVLYKKLYNYKVFGINTKDVFFCNAHEWKNILCIKIIILFAFLSKKVDYTLFIRSDDGSWRQVFRIPKFELCESLKSGTSVAMFGNIVRRLRQMFNTLPSQCPSKVPSRVEIPGINYTSEFEHALLNDFKTIMKMPFPIGVYKSNMVYSADDDIKVLRLEWIQDLK